MIPKMAVEMETYDSEGQSVLYHVYSKHDWYENLHPIIDSDAERTRLRISRIRGKQYDINGDIEVTWDLSYAENGTLIEEQVWRKDGSTDHRSFPTDR